MVIEVGSKSDLENHGRHGVWIQLQEYMDLVGERWEGLLLGLAISDNWVAMSEMRATANGSKGVRAHALKWSRGKWVASEESDPTWVMIHDKRFIAKLDEMRDCGFQHAEKLA